MYDIYFLLVAFLAAATDLVVRVDALAERGFDAERLLLAARPRAVDFGVSIFLGAGVTGFAGVVNDLAGVSAFFAGVAVLLVTLTPARAGVVARTAAAFTGLVDLARAVFFGGDATASAAFLAAALFGFASAFLAGVDGSTFFFGVDGSSAFCLG